MRHALVLIAALALLGAGHAARSDDFALPALDPPGKAVSLYGSWYHMVNAHTVSHKAPYGRGSSGRILVPYRSVAADRHLYPAGTVLYIPDLRGRVMTHRDGTRFTHDGYVMVVDSGSGVHNGHIDFFAGGARRNPAPLLFNGRHHPFRAYVVSDIAIVAAVNALHDPDAIQP